MTHLGERVNNSEDCVITLQGQEACDEINCYVGPGAFKHRKGVQEVHRGLVEGFTAGAE